MASAGFMAGFAGQIVKEREAEKERQQREKELMQENIMYLKKTTLPLIVDRRQKDAAANSALESQGAYLKTRGLTDYQISAIYDADGLDGLAATREAIEKQDAKGKPLTVKQVSGFVDVASSSLPEDVSFSEHLRSKQVAAPEVTEESFTTGEFDQSWADYAYGTGLGGGTGGSVVTYDYSGMPSTSSLSPSEQKMQLELFTAPISTSIAAINDSNRQWASEEEKNAAWAAASAAQTAMDAKSPYTALTILQDAGAIPASTFQDIVMSDPTILDNPFIPAPDRQTAQELYTNQQALLNAVGSSETEEDKQGYISSFVAMFGADKLPPQLR